MLHPDWHYHFLGIGGVGMSALARVLHGRGFHVSGSDAEDGPALRGLAAAGIAVSVGHDPAALEGAQAAVFSAALAHDHPIRAEAARRGLAGFHRAEVLGALTRTGRALAVAGTHGKTTVTACLTHALAHAGWDPTAVIGGHVPQLNGENFRLGESDWLVVEADESDGSFSFLSPAAVLLTNVEADHLDQHGTRENVLAAFGRFLARLPQDGLLVFCADDPGAREVAARGPWRTRSYGAGEGAQVRVAAVEIGQDGMEVTLAVEGQELRCRSRLVGRHNALNLAGAFALGDALGVPRPALLEGLEGFEGVRRRQQYLGSVGGCRIFDDYAHHPTEIAATLAMFQERFADPVTIVFQPHLYSRTAHFAAEFAAALRPAHRVVLTEIYGAREAPVEGVSSRLIMEGLAGHPRAELVADWRELPRRAKSGGLLQGVLVTMGAGDITGLGPLLLSPQLLSPQLLSKDGQP